MALNKAILAQAIAKAFIDQTAKKENTEAAIQDLATKIADAIDIYVKDLQITYTTGLTASTYSVVGSFTYTLS